MSFPDPPLNFSPPNLAPVSRAGYAPTMWKWVNLCLVMAGCWCGNLSAREVRISLLHTTDLHGHLLPSRDYEGRENVGGLIRMAAKIQEIRSHTKNVLLVDGGDFLQGTPQSHLTGGDLTRKAMEWLDYDAVVVGNHEFDWGIDFFYEFQSKTTLPLLAANIDAPGNRPLENIKPYVVRDVDGVRVVIVGLITPGMRKWYRDEDLAPLTFNRSVKTLQRVLPEIKALRPDVLVLAAHMGYPAFGRQREVNEIEAILKQVPEIDVVIGGHTHRVHTEKLSHQRAYGQAGYHGIWLGRIDLVFDTVVKSITSFDLKTYPVTGDTAESSELKQLLQPELDRVEEQLAVELGSIDRRLTPLGKPRGQSGIQQLFAESIAAETDADIVFHGVLSDRETLEKGIVHERDLWRIVRYENRLVTAKLDQQEIRAILEENIDYLHHPYFMGVWGLRYEVDNKAAKGERIKALYLPNGNKLHSNKRYTVAFNSFAAASGGGRFIELRRILEIPNARMKMTKIQTRDAVRNYLKKNHPWTDHSTDGPVFVK